MQLDKIEQDKVLQILKNQWQFLRNHHGSLYDRGQADSYYGRSPMAHYGGVGGDSGPQIMVTDDASIAEYMAGYYWNEQFGEKKEW